MLTRRKQIALLSSVVVLFLVVVGAVLFTQVFGKQLPEEIQVILRDGDTFELLSIDGTQWPNNRQQSATRFYGWPVLGRTLVDDSDARTELISALNTGIAWNPGHQYKCFRPRHAIHAIHNGQVVDLLICFECNSMEVYFNGKELPHVLTTASPQPTFDKILTDANVKLADPSG